MRAFAEAGHRFWPITSLDQIAPLLVAAGKFAVGVPERGSRVAQHVGAAVHDVAALLDRLPVLLRELIGVLPAQDGMAFITDRKTCIVCESLLATLRPKVRPNGVIAYHTRPSFYSNHGVLSGATLYQKRCTVCQATHFLSYATGGSVLGEKQQFYPNCTEARFFQVAPYSIVETSVLVDYQAQALCSHTGIHTFMQEYQMKYGPLHASMVRARANFGHLFFGWTLLHWERELGIATEPVAVSSVPKLDATLLERHARIDAMFTNYWGTNHAAVCRAVGACICHALDGHMKARRPCCHNKWARIIDRGALGKLAVNCSHDPMQGSKYCRTCRESCAVAGPAALVGLGGTTQLYVPGGAEAEAEASARAAAEVAAKAKEERLAATKARGWEIESKEKNVYLVEALLDKKPATVKELGDQHRLCARHQKKMYLVKWVGYGPEHNSWVCHEDVGKAAIEAFEAERAERRQPKHAGQVAAAVAAEGFGLFSRSQLDEQSDKEIQCETLKEFQYTEKKTTTAGVLALVASCGLILKVKEMYGCEALKYVLDFMYEAYYVNHIPRPLVWAYDDACHLKKYLINRVNVGWFVRWLITGVDGTFRSVFCDRFHYPNHKSDWCKANVNPAKCKVPGFEKSNTQAAEQCFAWLAGSKKQFRHMGEARFLFVMLRLAHLRNKQLCEAGLEAAAEDGTDEEVDTAEEGEGEGEDMYM